MGMFTSVNKYITPRLSPWIVLLGARLSAYQVFGYLGFFSALSLGFLLAALLNLSPTVVGLIAIAQVVVFFLLAWLTKLVRGNEQLVLLRQIIAGGMAAQMVLHLVKGPTLPYLDIVVVSIALFIAIGRVGCLMAGCCHGRPCRHGISYGKKHLRNGFVPFYANVGLFPTQLIESLVAFLLALVGSSLIVHGVVPGYVSAYVIIGYAGARFVLEFWRGDCTRLFGLGFSEAQWTALLLTGAVVLAEVSGLFPFNWWHALVFATLAGIFIFLFAANANGIPNPTSIVQAPHLQEMAQFLYSPTKNSLGKKAFSSSEQGSVTMCVTAQGIQISKSHVRESDKEIVCYAISCGKTRLSSRLLRVLSEMISIIKHQDAGQNLVLNRGNLDYIIFEYIHSCNDISKELKN